MGPEGAANILFRKEIATSANPEETRARLEKEFRDKYVNPTHAAAHQHVDDIIASRDMRIRLIQSLEMTMEKRQDAPARKHGVPPV
jgi:acetyl-CoA carboxylase carboxyltransferase component